MIPDDCTPPQPHLPQNRFHVAIRDFRHAVMPLLPSSHEPLGSTPTMSAERYFAAMTDEEIEYWDLTELNIGLVCGELSGTVLEVTTRSAQDWLFEQEVPRTPVWFNRRSRCYLFNYVRELTRPITELRPGLRLLNDGASVIYPGSMYDDGGLVYWEDSPDWVEPADLPGWLKPARKVVQFPS